MNTFYCHISFIEHLNARISTINCSIPYYLNQFQTGKTFDVNEIEGFVRSIRFYVEHPEQWSIESRQAIKASKYFTYSRYLEEVKRILGIGQS